MRISQKIKAAMKLLKEIAHEYATMTRKNKCIPATRKKGVRSKKEKSATKKRVQFSNKNAAPVPIEEPVEEPAELVEETVEKPVEEPMKENPFETEPEPEETEGEINPIDDGLNPST
jgi:hypothetical protein